MNTLAAQQLNQALGSKTDQPEWVASQILNQLIAKQMQDQNLGLPERLFIRLNALLPALLDKALRKQLTTIKQFARRQAAGLTHNALAEVKSVPASDKGACK